MPRKASGEFDQRQYERQFREQAYDRLNIVIPKGRLEDVKALAIQRDTTVNKMVNSFFQSELAMSDEQWRAKPAK